MGSYRSKLTGACYGNGHGIGGLGGYCVGSGYGVARAWRPCCNYTTEIS